MRGLKAKTMRRVARDTGIAELKYRVKIHTKLVENPDFPKKSDDQFISVERPQLVLDRCQRLALQTMKKTCPKGSFFGMPLQMFRGKARSAMSIQAFDTREAALAAAGQQ